jgi:hypothetical protein
MAQNKEMNQCCKKLKHRFDVEPGISQCLNVFFLIISCFVPLFSPSNTQTMPI